MRTANVLLALMLGGIVAGPVPAIRADGADRREQFKERYQKVVAMRHASMAFFAAKENGDRAAAVAAADKAALLWKSLPENWQKAIEEKHPGTTERITALQGEFDLPDEPAVPGAPAAAQAAGGAAARESAAGSDGRTVTWQDTWTRDGTTVSHEGTRTGPGGKTATVDATITREGSTVTKDATYTGPGGKTAEQDVTWTRDGKTVTREGTTVAGSKSVTSQDTWTKDGKTVTREGTTQTSGGKTATRSDTWVKDGKTVTHEGTVSGNLGAGKGWKPNYKDDTDVFGGKPRPGKVARVALPGK